MTKMINGERPIRTFAVAMLRRFYWQAQDGKCGICKGPMAKKPGSPLLNFDHVWPKSRACHNGGPEALFKGNLLLAHQACNEAKADNPPSAEQVEFLAEINRKLGFAPHETALWDRAE